MDLVVLNHQGVNYTISRSRFLACSLKAQELLTYSYEKMFYIQDNLLPAEFSMLISAINAPIFQPCNYDLIMILRASYAWQCPDLIRIIQNGIITAGSTEYIITALQIPLSGCDSFPILEQYVASNFSLFQSDQRFLLVQPFTIDRIIGPTYPHPEFNQNELFIFLKQYLSVFPLVSSFLFRHIDFMKFTFDQISDLVFDQNFDTSLVSISQNLTNFLNFHENEIKQKTEEEDVKGSAILENLRKERNELLSKANPNTDDFEKLEQNYLFLEEQAKSFAKIQAINIKEGREKSNEIQKEKTRLTKIKKNLTADLNSINQLKKAALAAYWNEQYSFAHEGTSSESDSDDGQFDGYDEIAENIRNSQLSFHAERDKENAKMNMSSHSEPVNIEHLNLGGYGNSCYGANGYGSIIRNKNNSKQNDSILNHFSVKKKDFEYGDNHILEYDDTDEEDMVD